MITVQSTQKNEMVLKILIKKKIPKMTTKPVKISFENFPQIGKINQKRALC